MDEEKLKELAKQLSHPEGEAGLELAALMHQTNITMTEAAIDQLELEKSKGYHILEIGHAHAMHLSDLLEKAPKSTYIGLEISELMQESASTFNSELVQTKQAKFQLYDGENIQFENETFDRIFSVNTLYFWKNPINFLTEIERVLKVNGLVTISFGDESYMKDLPFTPYGFKLYSLNKFEKLYKKTSLVLHSYQQVEEELLSKTGEKVMRIFQSVCLRKTK